MYLPKDPNMLMSVLNTKLRDCYSSLSELCEDLEVDGVEINAILARGNFQYKPEINQFR